MTGGELRILVVGHATGAGAATPMVEGRARIETASGAAAVEAVQRAQDAGSPFALAIVRTRSGGLDIAHRMAAAGPTLLLVLPLSPTPDPASALFPHRIFFAEPGSRAEAELVRSLLARSRAEDRSDETRSQLEISNRAHAMVSGEFRRQNARLSAQERQLSIQASLLQATLDNVPHGLMMVDADLRVRMINHRVMAVAGYPQGSVAVGTSGDRLMALSIEAGHYGGTTPDEVKALWAQWVGARTPGTVQHDLPDGRVITVTRAPMSDGGWLLTFEDVTAHVLAERALAEQASLHQITLDNVRHGLVMFDPAFQIRMFNRRVMEVAGYPVGSIRLGMRGLDLIALAVRLGHYGDADIETVRTDWRARLSPRRPGSLRHNLADGRIMLITYTPMSDGGWLLTYEDVTAQALAERALEEQIRRFDATIDNMPYGVCLFDIDGRIILCNPTYANMYALPPEMTRPGTSLTEILRHRVMLGNAPEDVEGYFRITADAAQSGRNAAIQVPLMDGRTVQIRHNVVPGGGYVATHEDITDSLRAEARIRYLAGHDALTGLPNRAQLRERLEEALARVRRGERLAVISIDLDRFKAVNDALGHSAGDKLLQDVTERLKACVGDDDMVARLGGDEFVVIKPRIDTPEQAGALGRRIIEDLSAPYDIDGDQVVVGASVGIAFAPGDGVAVDTLLKNADMAVYRAKSDGRDTCRFFEPAMDARVNARRALELDLRKALALDQFEVHYQPVFDARTQTVTGCEALLRWNHPERGRVPPSEFIPLAEECGLIIPLGAWVLRAACLEALNWPSEVKVAVNLSPAQFKARTLTQTVVAILAETGLPPNRLELEITESVLLAENELTLSTLHHLRTLGVRIAMDDFGTGYSSLSYLRSFPFDRIKIDRSFVRDLGDTSDCLAIIRAVATLGASLGMATTAEGVETEEQMRQVRDQGCTEIQGYYFSPPRPGPVIAEFLGERAGWAELGPGDRRRGKARTTVMSTGLSVPAAS